MTTNLKSFFLFISALILNVQLTTPIENNVPVESCYCELVTEKAELDKSRLLPTNHFVQTQQRSMLLAQVLLTEFQPELFAGKPRFIGLEHNEYQGKLIVFQSSQQLQYIQQSLIFQELNSNLEKLKPQKLQLFKDPSQKIHTQLS